VDNDIQGNMDLQHLSKNDGIFRNCVQGITTLKQQVGRNFLGYSFAKFQALPIFFFYFSKDLHGSSGQEESHVVSFMSLGGVLRALMRVLVLVFLNHCKGCIRGKKTKYHDGSSMLYTIGGILEAAFQSYGMLISARLVVEGMELCSDVHIAE